LRPMPSESEPAFFPAPVPTLARNTENPQHAHQNSTGSEIQEKILQGTSTVRMGQSVDLTGGPMRPMVNGIQTRRELASFGRPGLETGKRNQQVDYAPLANKVDRKAVKPTHEQPKFDLLKTVNLIREWFTIVSLFHLIGSEEAYKRIREKIDVLAGDSSAPDWQPTIEQKLVQLCRELKKKNDRVTQQFEADEVACSALDLKVAAYFQGKTSYDPSELMENPILPTVERFEPNKARQKIILMRLDKV
jgi:hypothetical protein